MAGHTFDDRCLAPAETIVTEDILEDALSLFEHLPLQNRRTILDSGWTINPPRTHRMRKRFLPDGRKTPPGTKNSGVYPTAAYPGMPR